MGKKEKKKAKKKAKKIKKVKKSKKSKSREPPEEGELISEPHPFVTVSKINPDEIPEDPGSNFLSRDNRDKPDRDSKRRDSRDSDRRNSNSDRRDSNSDRRSRRDDRKDEDRRYTSDRKKIKGRGRLTYRPISRSRSRSRTPPHWRAEKRKTISLKEFEKLKEEKAK